MIFAKLQSLADQQPLASAVVLDNQSYSYPKLVARILKLVATHEGCGGQRIGVWISNPAKLIASLGALNILGAETILFSAVRRSILLLFSTGR